MHFSSRDTMGFILHRSTQICRDSVGLALPCQSLPPSPACRGLPGLPRPISRFRIAGERRLRTVILRNEHIYSRSKFGSEENHFGASRIGRDFHAVADRRRWDEFNLVSREDSPARWDGCFL